MFFKNPLLDRIEKLKERMDALEKRLDINEKLLQRHAEGLAELDDKHVRLRGKLYAHKLHKPPEEETSEEKPIDQMTRDELRRSLVRSGRFIPGKPVAHD